MFDTIQRFAYELEGRRQTIKTELDRDIAVLDKLNKTIADHEAARGIVNVILSTTQESVRQLLEETITTTLQAVFGDSYRFIVKYIMRDEHYVVDCHVDNNGIELSLKDDSGGGVVDVVSFGTRLALWSVTSPRSDSIFIMDEPFRFVSRDLIGRVGDMLRHITTAMSVQTLFVTHEDELLRLCDRAWLVVRENGVSRAQEQQAVA